MPLATRMLQLIKAVENWEHEGGQTQAKSEKSCVCVCVLHWLSHTVISRFPTHIFLFLLLWLFFLFLYNEPIPGLQTTWFKVMADVCSFHITQ